MYPHLDQLLLTVVAKGNSLVGQDFWDFLIGISGVEALRYEEFVKKG